MQQLNPRVYIFHSLRKSFFFLLSFFIVLVSWHSRVRYKVAINMSIWNSKDLGDVSMKVSWALLGPAVRKS